MMSGDNGYGLARVVAPASRLLERVPSEQGQWKPHEKSFSLGHLAQLVTWMPGWIGRTLREPEIDLSRAAGYSLEPTETLLSEFDRNAAASRDALASVTGDALDEPWSLTTGSHVIFTSPRGLAARGHRDLAYLLYHGTTGPVPDRARLTRFRRP